MSSKIVSAAVLASVLAAVSVPVAAYAEDAAAPKTKAECLKTKDMHWDTKTNACVKK